MSQQPDPTLRDPMKGSGKMWAYCLDCGHGERLDAWRVVRTVGRDRHAGGVSAAEMMALARA
jgi:hypothetical protein